MSSSIWPRPCCGQAASSAPLSWWRWWRRRRWRWARCYVTCPHPETDRLEAKQLRMCLLSKRVVVLRQKSKRGRRLLEARRQARRVEKVECGALRASSFSVVQAAQNDFQALMGLFKGPWFACCVDLVSQSARGLECPPSQRPEERETAFACA